jgi:DNA mismatch repair ATPase MutS
LVEEVENGKDTGSTELKPRRVGRVVTPGTLVDESWLSGSESRYLLALAVGKEAMHGVDDKFPLSMAYTDASTGEFFSKDTDLGQMEDELARVAPREVVLDNSLKEMWEAGEYAVESPLGQLLDLLRVLGVYVSFADPTRAPLLDGLSSIRSSETLSTAPTLETQAISLLRHHLQYALRDSMPSLPDAPQRQLASSQMQIDAATLAALEIRHAIRPGGLVEPPSPGRPSTLLSARGTLLSVLAQTRTASGHRLLIRTLTSPSTDIAAINRRLSLVQALVDRRDLRDDLRESLRDSGDIMRVLQRFKGQRGTGRDIWDTAKWIRGVEKLLARIKQDIPTSRETASAIPSPDCIHDTPEGIDRLRALLGHLSDLSSIADKIEASVDETNLLRGLDLETDEEDLEGLEAAGDALVASTGSKKDGETRREVKEREREEREQAIWWIRPG